MVCWLVQQQDVWLSEQQTNETQAILLTAGKFFCFERPLVAIEAQPLQDSLSPGSVFESTFALKLVLQIAVTLQDLLQITSRVGHAMLEFVHLVLDLLQMAKCCKRGFVNRRAGFKMYMLS